MLGLGESARRSTLLDALQELPATLGRILEQDERIAGVADRTAPSRRHWAVVGNGSNRVAAQEAAIIEALREVVASVAGEKLIAGLAAG